MISNHLFFVLVLTCVTTLVSPKKNQCDCPQQTDCEIFANSVDVIVAQITTPTLGLFDATVKNSMKGYLEVSSIVSIHYNDSCQNRKRSGTYLMSLTLQDGTPFVGCGIWVPQKQIPPHWSEMLSDIETSCPGTCKDSGKTYTNGQTWQPSPCTFCSCDRGQTICAMIDCARPPCEDYYVPVGQCCPICPRSFVGCLDSTGETHDEGATWTPSPCETCECYGGSIVCSATCPKCEHPIWMKNECCCSEACPYEQCDLDCGEFKYDDKGCKLCECLVCPKMPCYAPPCDNPKLFPGTCCPSCPVDCSAVTCPAL